MLEEFLEPFFQNLAFVLPQILWAILVFIFGFFISKWIGNIVIRFLEKTRINQAAKRIGWEEAFSKIDTKLNLPKICGGVVTLFLIILFLVASTEILGLVQFSQTLRDVLSYFPNIFIACLIFILAIFLTDFSQKIVVAVLEKERITYSRLVGRISQWAIWILAILAILYQLKIVPTLILTIFIGMVALIVITLGIAFGLGGKDLAAKILKELEEKIR